MLERINVFEVPKKVQPICVNLLWNPILILGPSCPEILD